MSVSLIIPIHNSATILSQTLSGLEKQKYALSEVILIDNNSTDSSYWIIEDYKKRSKFPVKIIRHKTDLGLAHSYNQAILTAKTDYLITLQSDCVIKDERGVEKLLQPFEKDHKIVASCSLQTTPWAVWETYNFWQKCLFSRHAGRIASGRNGRFCCFLVTALKKAGLFNEIQYRTAGEDGDLFMRLEDLGKIVDVDLVVDHLHSNRDDFSLKDYIYKENQLAEATGACLANNFSRASLVNYFTVILRPVLILGLLIPKINYLFFILILMYSIYLTINVFRKAWFNYRIIFLPFVNIFLLFSFTFMFLRGLITKKQVL